MNTNYALLAPWAMPGEGVASMISRAIFRFVERVDAHRRYRRTCRELHALTDSELDDIGVLRADIEAVARCC
ncbi:MAG: DUF1127 domain-containing protein [Geminicoccaceae bacterium]|nr:DUF1127 domain-containing protein [Geminicoccaceae bacterium]